MAPFAHAFPRAAALLERLQARPGDLLVINPAPDASPPMGPTGASVTVTAPAPRSLWPYRMSARALRLSAQGGVS